MLRKVIAKSLTIATRSSVSDIPGLSVSEGFSHSNDISKGDIYFARSNHLLSRERLSSCCVELVQVRRSEFKINSFFTWDRCMATHMPVRDFEVFTLVSVDCEICYFCHYCIFVVVFVVGNLINIFDSFIFGDTI
jgi:hypothetical protein